MSWSFKDTLSAPAAFYSDGGGAYQQNLGGVFNSLFSRKNFLQPSHFQGWTRAIRVLMPAHIPRSIVDDGPALFAGRASFLTAGQMNIRDILG